jgi:hypothetical protein
LPDAIPDLGHALGLGKCRPLVERSVANLALGKEAVFLRVAIGLLGDVGRLVKDPHLALGVALQPHEGLADVGRTLDHFDKLSGVAGAKAGATGCGELETRRGLTDQEPVPAPIPPAGRVVGMVLAQV